MMPWEHALVGYIVYSLLVHAVYRSPPASDGTLVLVTASVLPDLIDKPLAWGLGVFTSGYAVGHSALVAVPVVTVVAWAVASRGRPRLGLALSVGYPLHLLGDTLPGYLLGEEASFARLLWPVRPEGAGYEQGFVGEFRSNMTEYFRWLGEQVVSGDPEPYLLALLGVGLAGTALWVYDGMPVGRDVVPVVRRAGRAVARYVHE